jgi:hypothetical protein
MGLGASDGRDRVPSPSVSRVAQSVCGGRFYGGAAGDEAWSAIKAEAREAIRARGEDPNDSVDPTEDARDEYQ